MNLEELNNLEIQNAIKQKKDGQSMELLDMALGGY